MAATADAHPADTPTGTLATGVVGTSRFDDDFWLTAQAMPPATSAPTARTPTITPVGSLRRLAVGVAVAGEAAATDGAGVTIGWALGAGGIGATGGGPCASSKLDPADATIVVHAAPSQYRCSWRPTGSGYQPAVVIASAAFEVATRALGMTRVHGLSAEP